MNEKIFIRIIYMHILKIFLQYSGFDIISIGLNKKLETFSHSGVSVVLLAHHQKEKKNLKKSIIL